MQGFKLMKSVKRTSSIPKALRFFGSFFMALIFLLSQSSLVVSAQERNIYQKLDTPLYDLSDTGSCGITPSITGQATVSVSPGSGTPTGLTYPSLTAEVLASSIKRYIQSTKPSSVFINNPAGADATIAALIASAKKANINPFFVIAIAQKESSLGDPGDFNVRKGNNSFGRKASASQPFFLGAGPNAGTHWYKWDSVIASVDFNDPSNNGSQNGDQVSYMRTQFGASIDAGDLPGAIAAYAPPDRNDTLQYIKDVKSEMAKMAALAGSPVTTGGAAPSPSPSATATSGTCISGAEAIPPPDIIKHVVFSGATINPTDVVLHWTDGDPNASVDSFVAAIKSNTSCGAGGCSVQFYIDGAGKIYQLVDPINTFTEHAGHGYNSTSIGIEIGGRGAADLLGNAVQKQSVISLTAFIINQFSMQIEPDVPGHKGILSHHLFAPDKQDVGDAYHQQIVQAVKLGASAGGTFTPGDPSSLPPLQNGPPSFGNPNVRLGQQLAQQYGWSNGNEFACLYDLWTRESGWSEKAKNPSSGAYGIPQSLPADKMSSFGADWRTNPATQIKWGLDYINGRYHSPCAAIVWHNAHNWY